MKRTNILTVVSAGLLAGCGGTSGGDAFATPPADAAQAAGRGSVTAGRVSADMGHYESVVEMIRGRAPGVELLEVSPGVIEVRIRGMNQSLQVTGQEPLVVVDGVPSSRPAGQALMSLNPNDVASIDILKDVSSTTVYGTRGANGVILITMKRRVPQVP